MPSRLENRGRYPAEWLYSAAEGSAVHQYVIALETAKLSTETIDDRIGTLERLRRFAGGGSLLELTAAQLHTWQASIRHLSANTVRVYTTHVQQFFIWAADAGLVDADPSRRLVKPRVARGVPHPIAQQEIETLFAICPNPPLRLIFALAAFAGLRCGEIARLQRMDIDFFASHPTIFVRGKGRRERYVPLIGPLAEELTAAGVAERGPQPVITRDNGRAYTPDGLSKIANDWLHTTLGTDAVLHSLRHWYATHIAQLTKDLLLVRDLLGHASLSTTQIYTQTAAIEPEKLDAFAEAAGGVLGLGSRSSRGRNRRTETKWSRDQNEVVGRSAGPSIDSAPRIARILQAD
jgi:site-specific recombinase XerD